MLASIMPKTITHKTAIEIPKTPPETPEGSTMNAIIIAPNTINGERINSLKTRFTPDCNWFTSLVIRVIILPVPKPSIRL